MKKTQIRSLIATMKGPKLPTGVTVVMNSTEDGVAINVVSESPISDRLETIAIQTYLNVNAAILAQFDKQEETVKAAVAQAQNSIPS